MVEDFDETQVKGRRFPLSIIIVMECSIEILISSRSGLFEKPKATTLKINIMV